MSPQRNGLDRLLAGVLAVVTGTAGSVLTLPAPAGAVSTLPTVTGLSVTRGTTSGGTNLLITGARFTGVSESNGVSFGTTAAASILVLSDTQIAVKAPAGTGAADTGLVDVKVTNSAGTSAVSATAKFAYRQPIVATVPTDTLLNPISGSSVIVAMDYTLSGSTGFVSEKITATIGGAAALVAYSDTTHVRLTVPAGIPSNNPTTVTLFHDGIAGTPDTTNAKYVAVISSLSRTSGPKAGGGSNITVTGKGLTGSTLWLFGAESATCAATTDTTAICTVIPASDANTPVQGAVSVSFTPANSIPFGYTAGGAYTYTDMS